MKKAEFSFLMADEFIENFIAWRLLALEGRLGGGKTLLSVALAKWLYDHKKVRGVYANFPIDPDYIPAVASCLNTVVILDEGWSFADARQSANQYKGYGAMFRKLGSYLISPSVYAVDRRMRPVSAERQVDLWVIDSWLYLWRDVRNAKGHFLFRGYQSLFNKYDHRFIPSDDAGILITMKAEIQSLAGSRQPLFVFGKQEDKVVSPYGDPMEGHR